MSNNRARGLPTIVYDTADTSKSIKTRKNNSTDTPRRSQRLKQLVSCITPLQSNANNEDEEEEDGTSDNAGSADGRALYWSSTEAAKLFLGSKHATEDVFDCLEGRIELLDKVMNHYAGYREVVVGDGEGLSEFNVFHIRIKSMYLRTAYSLALEKLGVVVPNEPKSTWVGCCDKAVIMVRAIGYEGVTSKTLMTWNKYFRDDAKFPHPNPSLPTAFTQSQSQCSLSYSRRHLLIYLNSLLSIRITSMFKWRSSTSAMLCFQRYMNKPRSLGTTLKKWNSLESRLVLLTK